MKKTIILILTLICILVSGCSIIGKGNVRTLENAYFYLINNIENKENEEIDYVTDLLKDYKFKKVDNSDTHDVKGENAYNYIFTDDNQTSLNVNFIVSDNKQIIDHIEYLPRDKDISLEFYKENKECSYSLIGNNLDKSIYKKVIGNKYNKNELSDIYYSFIDKMDKGDEIKIEDIKKSLKDCTLEIDSTGDESIGLKICNYNFSNDKDEKIIVSTKIESNKETISDISYLIGSDSELLISSKFPAPGEKAKLYVSYNPSNITAYENFYDLIS